MKTRLILAAILLPLLLTVILVLPKVLTAILFGILSALVAYELLANTGLVKQTRLLIYSMVAAFCVSIWSYCGMSYAWGVLGLLAFLSLLFMEMMIGQMKLRLSKIALCLVGGLLMPYLLCSLVRLQAGDVTGRFYIMLPFVVAFLSDSGAYFIGKFLGKHQLAPLISPKKTIEGAVGGLATGIIGMLIYGLLLDFAFGFTVNYFYAMIYGLVGGLAGMFGDLWFSAIKRQTGIKDFGTILPGHGGVLDRFDSMMTVGPLLEILVVLLPVAVK